mmetsp:Transcript_35604/g.82699  ORF Transcript_35604/g.82699 Transcript_35604/m.82699 type:complete len:259 (-) Transcript_35604:93-869(-)
MGGACCSDIVQSKALTLAEEGPAKPAAPTKATSSKASSSKAASSKAAPAQAVPVQPAAPVSAPAPTGEQMVSQVGELPKFSKEKSRQHKHKRRPSSDRGFEEDAMSSDCASSVMSQDLSGVSSVVSEVATKQQKQQAKAVVKDFVREMRKGRKMNVMTQVGQLRSCKASLNRGLDTLSIKVGAQKRNIMLKEVEEIHTGSEPIEGVSTPLDELCATLMLKSDDCITFRLGDISDRNTFVMCLNMFCTHNAEAAGGGGR